mmetsp:Transcript_54141/g.155537  ORF Transcript_54141/g.155537 Transcript_54141/m.155537 type:complete len:110 (+) Transcript_54141:351-680(+)
MGVMDLVDLAGSRHRRGQLVSKLDLSVKSGFRPERSSPGTLLKEAKRAVGNLLQCWPRRRGHLTSTTFSASPLQLVSVLVRPQCGKAQDLANKSLQELVRTACLIPTVR